MGGGIDRRAMLGGLAASAAASPLMAKVPVGDDVIALWPGPAPGAPETLPVPQTHGSQDPGVTDRAMTGVDRPTLSVRRASNPNGAAMMLVPGGGYGFLAWDNEGEEQARWLTGLGVTCFILRYRLPAEGWAERATAPLSDAQRGLRLIRSRAMQYGVDPARIGVLGFSAGGHLAGSLATRADERVYAPIDAVDQVSARPNLAALVYPVVSLAAPFTHGGSRDTLLGPHQSEAQRQTFSIETRVTATTPPIFLAHASDDELVPIANSLALYQAMIAAKREGELHCFDKGGHGFGVRLPKSVPASAWPDLLAAYARRMRVFPS